MDQKNKENEYSISQLYRISVVYDLLAKALPTEGRDFAVKFSFPDEKDGSKMKVGFEPFTKIGKIWCDYCSDVLKNYTGNSK